MHGIKLITQMVFLLLYFITPHPTEAAPEPRVYRDISFTDDTLGGFFRELKQPTFSIEFDAMEASPSDSESGAIEWDDKYETPDQSGKALISSKGYEIIDGPYKGIFVSAEEVEMMECVVQRETGGSIEHRRIIAQVILNRVADPHFPNTVEAVLTAPRQFSTISNYYTKKRPPDDTTKQAVYEVLTGTCGFNSGGALYFYDPRYAAANLANWFETDLEFVFEFESHRFFK
ncbi:MAG: cell wall hydrolase [Clostridia bacterium]|nr:cell wall hydrolase [Clostridia bacterium]